MLYVCGAMWSIWNIQETTPRKKATIQHVTFLHDIFPMEIDDDEMKLKNSKKIMAIEYL